MRGISPVLVGLCLLVSNAVAFVTLSRPIVQQHSRSKNLFNACGRQTPKKSSLQMRQWNFNDSRSPFGLATNAEIWNGRVAQVAFTTIMLQELITGKGVVQGLEDGNFANQFFAGLFFVSVLGLGTWLAIIGEESKVECKEPADFEAPEGWYDNL
mmetsp:Transcript_41055/g.80360  ORF Transcript_41055/g.80360 Transcript_41055/m.80360 type:complete len:155 (+) Transcript_41055:110-574(+)